MPKCPPCAVPSTRPQRAIRSRPCQVLQVPSCQQVPRACIALSASPPCVNRDSRPCQPRHANRGKSVKRRALKGVSPDQRCGRPPDAIRQAGLSGRLVLPGSHTSTWPIFQAPCALGISPCQHVTSHHVAGLSSAMRHRLAYQHVEVASLPCAMRPPSLANACQTRSNPEPSIQPARVPNPSFATRSNPESRYIVRFTMSNSKQSQTKHTARSRLISKLVAIPNQVCVEGPAKRNETLETSSKSIPTGSRKGRLLQAYVEASCTIVSRSAA